MTGPIESADSGRSRHAPLTSTRRRLTMSGTSKDRDLRPVRITYMRKHRMRALICAASLLGLLTVVAWTSRPAGAQDDEKMTIKQIMGKIHKGSKAPIKN